MSNLVEKYHEVFIEKSDHLTLKLNELKKRKFFDLFGDVDFNSFNWKKGKISEFDSISIETGKYIRKQDLDPYGDYPVYGGHGIIGQHSEFLFEKGKIIVGRVGSYAGSVIISQKKSWVSNNAYVIHLDKDHFLPEFLGQMITILELNRYASGAAQPYLSTSVITNLEIIKPPIIRQLEFAHHFNKINTLNDKVQEREVLFNELISRIN
ncbi:MAG: restriction endonuclease subunit S [Balneolaceae bacterium]